MAWVRSTLIPTILCYNHRCQDYRTEKRWTIVGFCSGAIAGLVAITPGSGYVGSRTLHLSNKIRDCLNIFFWFQRLPFYLDSWLVRSAILPRKSSTIFDVMMPWM
jgi:hypothetical protein